MGAVVVDSSIVIGFLWPADPHHAAATEAIRSAGARGDTFVLPATVLAESLVGAHRLGTAPEKRRDLTAFFGPVRPVDEDVAWESSALRARHRSLRLPDALIVATGIVEDAVVLTADERLRGVDARVQVLEP